MRLVRGILMLFCFLTAVLGQESTGGPSDEKALKTYEKAQKALRERRKEEALDDFKKADKQDGGHCLACQKQMIKYGEELGEWKTAEPGAEEIAAQPQGPTNTALAHNPLPRFTRNHMM